LGYVPTLERPNIRAVTIRAVFWSGLVKQNRFTLNFALQGMAHRAAHIGVRPRQRELSAFVMIKYRGRPTFVHMTITTFCDSILGNKLPPMRIGMASLAIVGRPLELNFVGTHGDLVTFVTSHRAVGPDQRKFRFRMVEASYVNPGFGAVACFTAQRGAIGAFLCHALFEFSLVGIGVAGSACAVREMEWQNLVCSSAVAGFVALRAGGGHVRPGQDEMGVFVLGNRESRAMKVLYRMAVLAAILVGGGGKLFVVRVLMAIRAGREFHLVNGIFPRRGMTFIASDGPVFSFERIMRSRVFLYAKLRWLPTFDGMAFRALPLAGARLELPFVRIRGMAIRALRKRQRLFEIASGVAIAATHF